MKKILAGIAVLAVAAAAQAELLNTWTFTGGGNQTNERNEEIANYDKVTYTDLTLNNLTLTGTGTANKFLASQGWNGDNASVSTVVTVSNGYEITGAKFQVGGLNAANGGPGSMKWQLNGSDVGNQTWTVKYQSTASVADDYDIGKLAAGANTLSLVKAGSENTTGGSIGATGTFRLLNTLKLDGTIGTTGSDPSAVPEPATMSLLGLGALAMVIRRKLRK